MTRFYMYSSTKDDLEIIESTSLASFAENEFDPTTMAFTGVMIDAPDLDTALKVYKNPTCGDGEFMMADEPTCTLTRRADRLSAQLEYLQCMLKMKLVAMKLQEASNLIQDVSNVLYRLHNNPSHMPPQAIYNELSSTTIQRIMKYDGKPEKTG